VYNRQTNRQTDR